MTNALDGIRVLDLTTARAELAGKVLADHFGFTAEHLTRRYHHEFTVDLISKLCLAGSPDEVASRVAEYEQAGVRHLIFLYGGDPSDAVDQFTRLHDAVVAPRSGRPA